MGRGSLAAIFVAACGHADEMAAWEADHYEPEIVFCCAEEGPDNSFTMPAPEPDASVRINPDDLSFYADDATKASLDARRVVITNGTTLTVTISHVEVVDDRMLPGHRGDYEHFSVDTEGMASVLGRGEQTSFFVSFAPSSAERAAKLVVHTSHPSYRRIEAKMTGKYFQW
jgi:hypothetical protein